jgi:probable lipoprotein NlpC
MMSVDTSANGMNLVYLLYFLNFGMKQFFELKINQKQLLPVVLTATLFLLFSCSAHKQARVRDDRADQVIGAARSFIGTPYKYGGTSRAGMDCSGLLINSFRVIDVSLPRSSEGQSKIGEEVDMKDLQPGDLVFFATGNRKRKVTHVGLVTERKGKDNIKFIHASSTLGVVETNLFAEYYQKRFRGGRRVINN